MRVWPTGCESVSADGLGWERVDVERVVFRVDIVLALLT